MAKQPNSRNCFICGMENPAGLCLHFYDNDMDSVWTDFTIAPRHQSFPGVSHGGIVASILDEVGGRVLSIGNTTRFGMTAKLDVRYRQPVPLNEPLHAVGTRVKLRGRLLVAHAELQRPDGTVLSEAELLISELPLDRLHMDQADVLGWRVYPDPAKP